VNTLSTTASCRDFFSIKLSALFVFSMFPLRYLLIDKFPLLNMKKFGEKRRARNMRLGLSEGSVVTVMSIIAETYMTPFALALGANSAHIGFLNSTSGILPPLAQLSGSRALEKSIRRKVMVLAAFWQALTLLPLIILGLFSFGIFSPYLLILFYSSYAVFGAITGLAWFSLMGDIVPSEKRGRYFGKRNALLGGTGIMVTLAGSFFLDLFKTQGKVLLGFSLLFMVALVARLISLAMLKKYDDPDGKGRKLHDGFWHFTRTLGTSNYGRFVLYVSLLNFAVMIASPFFAVYMLQELHLSYIWYTIISLSQSVSILIFMLVWGKFADRYGNKKTLILGSILIPLLPLLWIFSQNPYYLLIPMFLGGIGWAAFNLASSNFVYDAVPREKRAAYLAYTNLFVGIGIFTGSVLGGLLIEYLPLHVMNIFLFVFLISAILRGLVAVVMLPLVKEVRKVKKFSFAHIAPLLQLKMPGNHTHLHHQVHLR